MPEEASLPQRILDTAETILRRHGVEKTNVVDVARALGMSHGNIYRHFPSKKALVDAVAVRWLNRLMDPLDAIAADHASPASARLATWFDALRVAKRAKVRDDPELFRVYHRVVETMREVVTDHVEALLEQLAGIIADGVAAGEFAATLDPPTAARAFLHATSTFHHPALVILEPLPTEIEARAVLDLLLAGLRAGMV